MEKYKLSEEVAEDQVQLFFDFYEIEMDDIPEEQTRAIDVSLGRIKKAIRRCRLEFVESDGVVKITQHLKNETTIVYGEISGRSKLAMKNKSDSDSYGKIYSLCGSLTGIGEAGIAKLKGADISLAECIGALFLQV